MCGKFLAGPTRPRGEAGSDRDFCNHWETQEEGKNIDVARKSHAVTILRLSRVLAAPPDHLTDAQIVQ